ncbi:MAG: cell division protein FtsA [Bdellovibrionota bacterium]|nr:MAG: cell division protein FtsA [Bdellovibrionota bacterium]
MGSKAATFVGLDIGTSYVKCVVTEIGADGKLNVVGVGSSPSRGLRKGVVINIEATVESISRAIEQAETMAGCDINAVYAGVSGSHIKGFNSHGIVGVKNREVSQVDVEKVIEAAKAVAIPLDREVLHVLPQEYIIDEQDGIREPLGISGVRLEARVHIVTGAVASAQNIVKCANRCGLAVKDIVLSSLASAKAVLSAEEQELGVAVLDIGGGTTDLIVFHGGAVKHTTVISVGGNHVTNDIAAGLRTPISAAEDIKCRFGTAVTNLVKRDETIEVPSTGGRQPRVLSKLVLAEIIEPRVMEMLTLVQKELVRSGCDEYLTSGLVITGGSANLHGICQLAEQVFNLPVRVGAPGGVGGVIDLVKGPEYATAVGLAIYGSAGSSMHHRGASRSSVGSVLRRAGNWISQHF